MKSCPKQILSKSFELPSEHAAEQGCIGHASAETTLPRTPLRADIQVLRAIAVLLVIGFHFWPSFVPGGFVGVDIFFVISGFLITANIVSEIKATGGLRLGAFWARRARRLLPLAYFVILVTSVMVFVFEPSSRWDAFIRQAIASTIYYENWALIADATDYLAGDAAPTALQQFWSLSTEEQFYIVWPLLLVGGVMVTRSQRRISATLVMAFVIAAVTIASFALSVVGVGRRDPAAYFSTLSRAWEFGLGGLVAVRVARRPSLKVSWAPAGVIAALTMTGWACIGASVVLLKPYTPFPGLWAALPTAGTATVLLGAWQASVPILLRPALDLATWLGDISYGLYLWHWPLITVYPYVAHKSHAAELDKVGLLALTVGLAQLTTRYVEAPVRGWRYLHGDKHWRTAALAAVFAAATVAPAVSVGVLQYTVARSNAHEAAGLMSNACFGAGTVDSPAECSSAVWPTLHPRPASARNDLSTLYAKKCISESADLIICRFGPAHAVHRIALIGDSHAAALFPAVERAFEGRRSHITTFTKFSCVYSTAPRSKDYDECVQWGQTLGAHLAETPFFDLIIVTGYASNLAQDVAAGVLTVEQAHAGFAQVWAPILARNVTRIVVVRDNPVWPEPPSGCLTSGKTLAECAAPRAAVETVTDFQYSAAQDVSGVQHVSLDTYFCSSSDCFAAVGGVAIYLDRSHITATYARTLGPVLARKFHELGLLRNGF